MRPPLAALDGNCIGASERPPSKRGVQATQGLFQSSMLKCRQAVQSAERGAAAEVARCVLSEAFDSWREDALGASVSESLSVRRAARFRRASLSLSALTRWREQASTSSRWRRSLWLLRWSLSAWVAEARLKAVAASMVLCSRSSHGRGLLKAALREWFSLARIEQAERRSLELLIANASEWAALERAHGGAPGGSALTPAAAATEPGLQNLLERGDRVACGEGLSEQHAPHSRGVRLDQEGRGEASPLRECTEAELLCQVELLDPILLLPTRPLSPSYIFVDDSPAAKKATVAHKHHGAPRACSPQRRLDGNGSAQDSDREPHRIPAQQIQHAAANRRPDGPGIRTSQSNTASSTQGARGVPGVKGSDRGRADPRAIFGHQKEAAARAVGGAAVCAHQQANCADSKLTPRQRMEPRTDRPHQRMQGAKPPAAKKPSPSSPAPGSYAALSRSRRTLKLQLSAGGPGIAALQVQVNKHASSAGRDGRCQLPPTEGGWPFGGHRAFSAGVPAHQGQPTGQGGASRTDPSGLRNSLGWQAQENGPFLAEGRDGDGGTADSGCREGAWGRVGAFDAPEAVARDADQYETARLDEAPVRGAEADDDGEAHTPRPRRSLPSPIDRGRWGDSLDPFHIEGVGSGIQAAHTGAQLDGGRGDVRLWGDDGRDACDSSMCVAPMDRREDRQHADVRVVDDKKLGHQTGGSRPARGTTGMAHSSGHRRKGGTTGESDAGAHVRRTSVESDELLHSSAAQTADQDIDSLAGLHDDYSALTSAGDESQGADFLMRMPWLKAYTIAVRGGVGSHHPRASRTKVDAISFDDVQRYWAGMGW